MSGFASSKGSNQKENVMLDKLYVNGESIANTLRRHQQILMDVQRDMKQKVNKGQFLMGLSSKLSLSDITSLSLDICSNDESIRLNQSNLEDQVGNTVKYYSERLDRFEVSMGQQLALLKQELKMKQRQWESREQTFMKKVKEGEQELVQILQKKGERSQLDKIMHLTSLLAIEFQLIKKRFSNCEIDYNLVWKQISNIYQIQQKVKTTLEIDQRSKDQQNNHEKQLEVCFKGSQNISCDNTFLPSLANSADRKAVKENQEFNVERSIRNIEQQLEGMQKNEEDHGFSIKLFGERLGVIENYHEIWFKSLKEIQKTKRELADAKADLEDIITSNSQFKEQCPLIIKDKVKDEVKVQSGAIKLQIQEVCQQMKRKVMSVFENYSKEEDVSLIRDRIDRMQDLFNQKLGAFSNAFKKHYDQSCSKIDNHEEKLKTHQKQIQLRMKAEQFDHHRQKLITSNEVLNLMKKLQGGIKNQFQQFAKQQAEINQVLCSENVLARWVWTSGALKGGNLVAWDKEIINTLPENFTYSPTDYSFRVARGGIYRFEFGFYAKKKPTIQILVNGQTIISAVNTNSYVVHHSSGKLKDISNSEVAGLSYYDFYTLQDNARIAIAYSGEIGHGFVGLQRI